MLRDTIIATLSSALLKPLDRLFLADRATIFMLHRFSVPDHGIVGHDPQFVALALETLRKRRLNIISLRALFELVENEKRVPPGTVVFTMDDGFRDQAEIGAELFCRYDCPATVFLISGLLDGDTWPWDDRVAWLLDNAGARRTSFDAAGETIELDTTDELGIGRSTRAVRRRCKRLDGAAIEALVAGLSAALELDVPDLPPSRYAPMTWSMARDLERRGIDFGPHTVNHYILSRLDDDAAAFELGTAWDRLRAELGNPLDVYAWPTGRSADFGERDQRLAASIGMRGAVATNDNYAVVAGAGVDRYALERFSLPPNRHDLLQYATWIERAKQVFRGRH